MKILVTGAAGYIGSRLSLYLSGRGEHEVVPLVRSLPPYLESWREIFEVLECDTTSRDEIRRSFPSDIDAVVHLAASNDVECSRDPERARAVNCQGTRIVLEAAEEGGCHSFIYFSTLQVYGKELAGSITVDSPIKTEDDYALTHYIAERSCELFSSRSGMRVDVLRPSNVFGAPIRREIDRWSLVPACFCRSAIEEGEIRLKSSGRQKRDFISLERLGRCTEILLEREGRGYGVHNLSSGSLFSILEVAQLVADCASEQLRREVKVICEGEEPRVATDFQVENDLLAAVDEDVMRQLLSFEIRETLEILGG